MTNTWIFFTAFGLCCKVAYLGAQQWPDPSYNSKLKAVDKMFWKTFLTELMKIENVLFFSVPLYTDVAFIYDVLDEKTKQRVRKLIREFGEKEFDQATAGDSEFRRLLSDKMRFKTIFYEMTGSVDERKLRSFINDKLSLPNKRFNLISADFDGSLSTLSNLLMAIEKDSIGSTCEVRFCPVQAIIASRPPLAIITLATWSITSIEELQDNAPIEFALNETRSVQVRAVQGVAHFEHVNFKFTDGCIGQILRVPYLPNFKLIFAISGRCSSAGVFLWKNMQHVKFNELRYDKEIMPMLVSIPIFKISANVDLKHKLKGTALADAFDQPSSSLYNALAFQAAEVIFNPKVPNNRSRNSKVADIGAFRAERPFYFALFHVPSSTTVVDALINNPGCTSECEILNV